MQGQANDAVHLLQKHRFGLQLLLPNGAVSRHRHGIVAHMVAHIQTGISACRAVPRHATAARAAQSAHTGRGGPVGADKNRVLVACCIHANILAYGSPMSAPRIYNAQHYWINKLYFSHPFLHPYERHPRPEPRHASRR